MEHYPPSLRSTEADKPIWKHHTEGFFTVASAREKLWSTKSINPLHWLLWYSGHLPRQSFTLWMASQNCLQTLDRLARMGITNNITCQLCNREEESHDHLFFQCHYARSVWSTLSTYGHIQWPTVPWTQVLQLASATLKGNGNINSLIAKIILAMVVYYLWYERNNRTFKNIHRTAQELSAEIIHLIRAHLMHSDVSKLVNDRIRATWNI